MSSCGVINALIRPVRAGCGSGQMISSRPPAPEWIASRKPSSFTIAATRLRPRPTPGVFSYLVGECVIQGDEMVASRIPTLLIANTCYFVHAAEAGPPQVRSIFGARRMIAPQERQTCLSSRVTSLAIA
jgi:hypothetical protein